MTIWFYATVNNAFVWSVDGKLRSDHIDYIRKPVGGGNGRKWLQIIKIKAIQSDIAVRTSLSQAKNIVVTY